MKRLRLRAGSALLPDGKSTDFQTLYRMKDGRTLNGMIGAKLSKFKMMCAMAAVLVLSGPAWSGERPIFSGERTGGFLKGVDSPAIVGDPVSATDNILLATASGDDDHEWFGRTVANVGDFNGDGLDDLAVGIPLANIDNEGRDSQGGIQLFLGGDEVLSVSLTYTNDENEEMFGWAIAALGDFNDDSYDDFAVGAPGTLVENRLEGRVFLFYGGAEPDLEPDSILVGESSGDRFGFSLAGGADVNGDSIPDLLVGAKYAGPEEEPGPGKVYLYYGGETPAATAGIILSGSSDGDQFGDSVSLGDLDGDGSADLAVGASRFHFEGQRGAICLYRGGVALDAIEDASLVASETETLFGRVIDAAADFNGDSYMDLLVSAPDGIVDGSRSGKVYIYTSDEDLNLTMAAAITAVTREEFFGFPVRWLPDLNEDNYADIGVGAPLRTAVNDEAGAMDLYLGGPVFSPTPAATLIGAATRDAFGSDFAVLTDVAEGGPAIFMGAPLADIPDPEEEDEDFNEAGVGYLFSIPLSNKPAAFPLFDIAARWYEDRSSTSTKAGDFDGNGRVDADDLLLLIRFLDRPDTE